MRKNLSLEFSFILTGINNFFEFHWDLRSVIHECCIYEIILFYERYIICGRFFTYFFKMKNASTSIYENKSLVQQRTSINNCQERTNYLKEWLCWFVLYIWWLRFSHENQIRITESWTHTFGWNDELQILKENYPYIDVEKNNESLVIQDLCEYVKIKLSLQWIIFQTSYLHGKKVSALVNYIFKNYCIKFHK